MKIKCFFGLHDPIITERIFIGYDYAVDKQFNRLEKFNNFILKSECFVCGKKLKARQKVMFPFAHKQIYDSNTNDWQ